jgi:hypothetical protein
MPPDESHESLSPDTIKKNANFHTESLFGESVAAEYNKLMAMSHPVRVLGQSAPPSMPLNFQPPNYENVRAVLNELRIALLDYDRYTIETSLEGLLCARGSSDEPENAWLSGLMSVYEEATELGDSDKLTTMFMMLKSVLLSASPTVLARLVEDDMFDGILGILEHDPEIPSESRIDHKKFVKEHSVFRSIISDIPLDLSNLIQQSFRIGYIRDTILARSLDDLSYQAFSNAINGLNYRVISGLVGAGGQSHPYASLLQSALPLIQPQTQLMIEFLYSIINATRTMGIEERVSVVRELSREECFDFLEAVLIDNGTIISFRVEEMAIEILIGIATSNTQEVRIRCMRNVSQNLLAIIISLLHKAKTESRVSQISDLFKLIFDQTPFEDKVINYFYENGYLEKLAAPLVTCDHRGGVFMHQTIIDLLTFCICNHPIICKSYILRFSSLVRTIRLILTSTYHIKSRIIQLAVIRLVRAIFWQKDQVYFRYLTAFNIPALIIQVLYSSRPDESGIVDGNMIYSACLEIITFACVNNQIWVMESLCRPGSETERLVRLMANEIRVKAHAELFIYMLSVVQRMQSPPPLMEDMNSRQSITSSRGRSLSPSERPILVPRPRRRSTTVLGSFDDFLGDVEDDHSDDDKSAGESDSAPESTHVQNNPAEGGLFDPLTAGQDAFVEVPANEQSPAQGEPDEPNEGNRKRMRFSDNSP